MFLGSCSGMHLLSPMSGVEDKYIFCVLANLSPTSHFCFASVLAEVVCLCYQDILLQMNLQCLMAGAVFCMLYKNPS